MGYYRHKPTVIEAFQWFKNGDHPEDNCMRPFEDTGLVPDEPREGAVVRYFRHPDVPGITICEFCGLTMHEHGWIDTIQGGHTVCPGDWVITDNRVVERDHHGHFYPCKPQIFLLTYEPVSSAMPSEKVSRETGEMVPMSTARRQAIREGNIDEDAPF